MGVKQMYKIMDRGKSTFTVSQRVIWLSSLALAIMSSIPKLFDHVSGPKEIIINSSIAFLFSLFIWYFNIYSLPKFTSRKTTRNFLNLRLFLSVLSGIFMMIVIVVLHQEIFQVTQLDTPIMFEIRGILINLIVYMFLHLLFQNYKTQQIEVELERTISVNLGAQYELLKQQINPHFLFNSLNTLKSMVETHDPQSSDFILKLSDFYRFTLESIKMDLITLEEEIKILEAYTFLLKARFEEGFHLENSIEERYFESGIPPFTLQLLIENCIKHNIVSLEKPLFIKLYTEENFIVVENPIQLKKGELSTGVGLDNINRRFVHLIEKEIEINKSDTTFKVKIPIIYEHHNH